MLKLATKKPNEEGYYWLKKYQCVPILVRIYKHPSKEKLAYTYLEGSALQWGFVNDLQNEKWAKIPECY